MAKKLEVYKCDVCGIITEVVSSGEGTLVCCGEDMILQDENTVDAAQEKHVPVIEKQDGKIKVTIGSVAHPMEDEHYIQWIELLADGKAYMQFLNPGDAPEAVFNVTADKVTAREFCNLHGQWKADA